MPPQIPLPPPRMIPHGELWPVVEPPLRDQAPPMWLEEVEEWESFESDPLDDVLTEDMVRKVQEIALAHEDVKKLLTDKRYLPIGTSLLDNKRDDEPDVSSLLFIFYNYTDNLVIEVLLDWESLEVTEVTEAHYQPAPVEEEIEQAILLARADDRLANRLTDDLEGMVILVSPVNPDDPYFAHRLFDIRFGRSDERLPRYLALVDLSTETVLKVGPIAQTNDAVKGENNG